MVFRGPFVPPNPQIMNVKDIIHALAALAFAIVVGGAVYEHAGVIPRWSAGPPASLAMYQGPYGINPGAFWEMIHPITLVLILITLGMSWKGPRRGHVLFNLVGYVVVMIVTFTYFVPELMAITGTPYADTIDPDLQARAATWEVLSLVRLVVIMVLALALILGLTKPSRSA